MSLTIPKVSPFSEEFGYVEHQLRLQLNAPSLELVDLFDISLKPVNLQFNNFVKSHQPANVVDVFIPTVGIKQSKNDIVSHGIKVHPNDGFTFTADTVPLNQSNVLNEVFHLQVALGKIINYQDIKAGIDSVKYLTQTPTVSNLQEGYETLRVGDNRFVVFNPGQVRALHVCKFEYKEGFSDQEPCYHICDICGNHNATIYCEHDAKRLCTECDEKIHTNDFAKDHKRSNLLESLPYIQKCPEHKNCNVMYYCQKCHCPVCMECKVKGSHAHGEASKHKLVPIDRAYTEAMNILKRPQPFFDDRQRKIDSALEEMDEKLQEIKMNQKTVEDEIMRIAMKAIEDSRIQNAKVANAVKSKQVELQRKKEELRRQKSMLEIYKAKGEPVPLLETVFRNMNLEKTLVDDLPPKIEAEGNLIVYGRIEVSPPRIEQAKSSKQSVMQRGLNSPQQNPSKPEYSYTYTTEEQSTVLEPKDPHYTKLTKMAQRKQAKYDAQGISINFVPFNESRILKDGTLRNKLYMCFPFKGVPEPHVLYSSDTHGRSFRMMKKMIDNMGITCVLVRCGDKVFGGFAASKWTSDGVKKTDKSSSFLFSITRDAFIPYGGQSEQKFYTMGTEDKICWGDKDLVIAGDDFDKCYSEIENSYGIGFLYGSQKAKEFLAGKSRFVADQIEVWGFFTPE